MKRLIAWIVGEAGCPACGEDLEVQEPGYHRCTSCSVVVDYTRGGWSYAGESGLRRLPGVMGLRFDRRKAA